MHTAVVTFDTITDPAQWSLYLNTIRANFGHDQFCAELDEDTMGEHPDFSPKAIIEIYGEDNQDSLKNIEAIRNLEFVIDIYSPEIEEEQRKEKNNCR